ncbi:hypothetical protein J6590_046417 [Homalodisca vitripennis]|nr:hypothetical protein J6590_046417 [Homalodisca vitripennis]
MLWELSGSRDHVAIQLSAAIVLCPFIGHRTSACRNSFDKFGCRKCGRPVAGSWEEGQTQSACRNAMRKFSITFVLVIRLEAGHIHDKRNANVKDTARKRRHLLYNKTIGTGNSLFTSTGGPVVYLTLYAEAIACSGDNIGCPSSPTNTYFHASQKPNGRGLGRSGRSTPPTAHSHRRTKASLRYGAPRGYLSIIQSVRMCAARADSSSRLGQIFGPVGVCAGRASPRTEPDIKVNNHDREFMANC